MSTTWIIILSVIGGLAIGGLLAWFILVRAFGAILDPFLALLLGGPFGTRKKK